MTRTAVPRRLAATLSGVALLAAATATTVAAERQRPSNLFTASGFTVRFADTPERAAQLRALPPERLAVRRKAGRTYYVYADPKGCNCAYVGTPEAYATYRNGGPGAPAIDGGPPPDYVQEMERSIDDDGSVLEPGSTLGGFLDEE
ncbi:hypothetical protein PQJ75_15700 [Rhodoplanes sp. TEM]|uniref:Uncharacterized protein n=1 Tax=Rhodoplanes tepidamans TaxID=200616 RepID=A0ABT5J4R1_RHOTP|nr:MULTISPECIES: hypothetical protein [Rhodoplanes]MDC7784401.1 hypothetical protein [Rhodoplanes tepidamans]MDC7985180.1 hypothetical protein [Rhodoplanes sp. TEM]MDQ0354470.1 hypothetical protein [Rhodoplanes tepidamans]